MARYIDADKVMEEINKIGGHNLCEWETIGVKALIDRQPTADVAPKSEVAKEIFAEIKEGLDKCKMLYCSNHDAFGYDELGVDHIIYELKKKYLEELK